MDWLDLRFALRQFVRRPGATVTMLVVLSIGMAVSATLFSFAKGFALEPAPGIERAHDLVRIRGKISKPHGIYARLFTREELDAQIASTSVFAKVAGWTEAVVAVERQGAADPDWVEASFVTDGYFDVLDVRTVAGPGLPPARDRSSELVAVMSRALRERHFATDADAVGATLKVAGQPVTIVGVSPPGFAGADGGDAHQLWLPDAARPVLSPSANAPLYAAAARLLPGVNQEHASAAMATLATNADVGAPVPDDPRETRSTDVVSMTTYSADPDFEREAKAAMTMLSLLGLVVLLITGTNTSALQTGIAMTRGREIAMRLSLGASRGRVLRQLLTENALLGIVAGALALTLLLLVEKFAMQYLPSVPLKVGLDSAAVVFTLSIGLTVGVLSGLSPALYATGVSVASTLKANAGGTAERRGRLQRGLVVAQVMLTQPLLVLLTAMTLVLVGAYQREAVQDLSHQLVHLRMRAADAGVGTVDPTRETAQIAQRLEALPGIARAIPHPAIEYGVDDYQAEASQVPAGAFELHVHVIAQGWFETMDQPVLVGRQFEATDAAPLDALHERPIVIGEDLAAKLWPGASPLGRRLAPPPHVKKPPLVVVGIVATRPGTQARPGDPFVVYALAPLDAKQISLLVRLRGDAATSIDEIRTALHQATPHLGVVELRTQADLQNEGRAELLDGIGALAVLGLLALGIAAIGLYAVVAFAVTQRTGEIAVRMAIGARPGQVVRRSMGDGLRLTAIGLAIVLPASLLGLAVISAMPQTLPPVPLWQVAAIAMLSISAIAAAATFIPSRRAARVQPARVLGGE